MGLAIISPALVFYSQRVDGKPYVNCVPYTMCTVMRWMGYDVPKTYGMRLRQAAGVPVREGLGTSYAQMNKAIDKLEPLAPVLFNKITEAELLAALPVDDTAGMVISVQARMEKLPESLRRPTVGLGYEGWHGIALAGQRDNGGTQQVWWMDPMGKASLGYVGLWVDWDDVADALRMKYGKFLNGRGAFGEAA